MPARKKEEEYDEEEDDEEEDDEYYEDEEEEVTLDDVNKGLDTLSKGLDVYAKLKKLNAPPPPPPQPRSLSNHEVRWISQDIIRKQKTDQEEKSEKTEEDKKKHKKWVIETIVKIAVPIIVALIGVGFYLMKH